LVGENALQKSFAPVRMGDQCRRKAQVQSQRSLFKSRRGKGEFEGRRSDSPPPVRSPYSGPEKMRGRFHLKVNLAIKGKSGGVQKNATQVSLLLGEIP